MGTTDPLWERMLIAGIGPLITVLLGGLVIKLLLDKRDQKERSRVAVEDRSANDRRVKEDREAQERRAAQEIRHELIGAMTKAASSLYMYSQIYGRAKQKISGIGLDEARKLLDAQYVASRVDGEVLEQRLAAYFDAVQSKEALGDTPGPRNPAEAWHAVMDCLTVHYFDLVGTNIANLCKINERGYGEKFHSGLTASDLASHKSRLKGYRQNLHVALKYVKDGMPHVAPKSDANEIPQPDGQT